MAIFGKKKRAEQTAPATTASAATTEETLVIEPATGDDLTGAADDGAFDFDAIARDLNASDGPSPFDDLLARPTVPAVPVQEIMAQDEARAAQTNGDSAFDFPPDDDDQVPADAFAVDEPVAAQSQAFDSFAADATHTAPAPSPAPSYDGADFGGFDANQNAPADSQGFDLDPTFGGAGGDIDIVPAETYAAPTEVHEVHDATPIAPQSQADLLHTAPILTTDIRPGSGGVASAKRGLPLGPLLGAGVALLALAGAGWWVFGRQQPEEEVSAPIVARKPVKPAAPPVASAPGAPPKVAVNPVPVAPGQGANPGVPPSATQLRAVKPGTGGVASQPPRVVQVPPNAVVPGTTTKATTTGTTTKVTTQTGVVSPATPAQPVTQAQLKQLWKRGANAKRRKDYAGARRAWQEILRLDPGHDGIQSALDKLPKS